ncbi:hypothetical protein [Tenuibacillus multivorans]|nr:hypothetical protein [Tenuibacillus multivorans]
MKERLAEYSVSNNYKINHIFEDAASGLNENRLKEESAFFNV